MVPTMPFEWDAIARFNGTLWESTAWQDAFWNVGCNAWGLWCLSALLAILETRRRWRTLSWRGMAFRLVMLALSFTVSLLWLVATMDMLGQIVD
jgi:hypothetical protein